MAEEGWSELPFDLLATIDEQLPAADHARFRSVCVAWNSAPSPPHPQLDPWLLLSPSSPGRGSPGGDEEKETNGDQEKQKHEEHCCQQLSTRFYSISEDRTYKLSLDHLADVMAECRAIVSYSPGGWLMYMDKVCELQCVHLATGKRIHPPSITTFPDVRETKTDCEGRIIGYDIYGLADDPFRLCDSVSWFYQRGIIVFPGPPPDRLLTTQNKSCKHHSVGTGCEYVIVVVVHAIGELALARKGDTSWTLIDLKAELLGISSLILHKGMLYVVKATGCNVFGIEFNSDLSFKSANALSTAFIFLTMGPYTLPSNAYLVDIDGHLWLIWRHTDLLTSEPNEDVDMGGSDMEFFTPRTSGFQVFKLAESQATWVEKETVGDYAIFVGNNYSLALSTNDCQYLTKDCIYFSDDYSDCYRRPTPWDLGVFNLRDKSVSPFYDRPISRDLPQPTWVMSFLF